MYRIFSRKMHWALPPLAVALYITLFLNQTLWELWRTATGAPHAATAATFAVMVALVMIMMAGLLLLFLPRIGKLMLVLVLLVAAANDYFSLRLGIVVDDAMVRNIFETDWQEALALVTQPLVKHLLIYGGIPSLVLAWVPVRPAGWQWCWQMPVLVLMSLLVAVAALGVQYKFFQLLFREHRELRLHINPTYAIYSLVKYGVHEEVSSSALPLQVVAADARVTHRPQRNRPLLAVFVVGETARADHFSLNGYVRDTNPELGRIEGLLSFNNAWSCGTSTAESLPCMFSDLPRAAYTPEKAARRQNVLDVLERVGIDVVWVDNNSGSKGVADRVSYLSRKKFPDSEIRAYCGSDECFDEVLPSVASRLFGEKPGDQLVVLHQMGEHGPSYHLRHPDAFRRFEPECEQNDVFNCSQEALINAYDNDILYTDHVLASVIARMRRLEKTHDLLFFYMSDHGESLGENGIYLHGAPWSIAPDAQKHVPLLLWMSDQAYRDLRINKTCMMNRLNESVDHDHIFHTLLGLFTNRKSDVYEANLDVLAACRG
ncbi:Conserved hypothetical protein [gamma proteobacterium HdN1]|nr:Conserved hypothetical protein [gamma proteobacterium HdN1]